MYGMTKIIIIYCFSNQIRTMSNTIWCFNWMCYWCVNLEYTFQYLVMRFVQHMRYDSTSIIYQSRRNTRINVDLKMLRMCKLSSCHFLFWHVGINFDIYLGNKNVILSAAISLHNKTMSSAEYLWIIQNSRISFLLFVLQSKC